MGLEKLLRPRPLLILAELFLLPAVLLASKSYNASIACLGASTILYYIGMTELVSRRLGRWAVKRFTIAYLLRALSWVLMLASAFYTYSAVIKNIFPFGPQEFVVTSVVALVGAGINYIAVGIRNSVLWKIKGLKMSLWMSRLNSIVLFLMAAVPFLPALSSAEEVTWLLAILAAPILGSFTVLAVLGKLFYLRFLLTFDETETSSQGFKREGGLPRRE
ncbi:hypothetical protein CL1_1116 [Thermococcus cleftensis]|uniref:Uncharacterized protein n=1 Tax=Thermococcus cleftensis (strain DSM 27260 / KACC 17922 / CL1) TaxID=163003 RepID=I3ZUD5_THECF|nr:hypothetical protein [Thermococcus cleftensis]AFL95319.1 hypothetical protein CL1_1116 [Thermococcus cleftensis]